METATRTKYHSLLFEIKHINMLRSICARSNTDTIFNKINARVQNSVVGKCFLLQSISFITLGKRFHLNNIQNQHFATLWCHAMQSNAFAYNIPVKSENCILCCLLLTVSLHTANAPQRYATEFTFWVDISFILLDSCDKKSS